METKKVTIYTAPLCHFCQAAKDFFNQHQIPFEEIDISQDTVKSEEIITKTHQVGVPVIEVDGQFILGFDKPLLEEVFGLQEEKN